ncbi:MAG: hypothetical protein [Bacteriophage sp.]|nr:MAG: hypothetical protein [Bacteriophage sp.]
MNTVTLLNATCERENIVKLFSRFASKYGTLWTGRLGANPDWDACIDDWFNDLRQYDYKTLVLAAKSALTIFTDFPPTFGQFEDLCKKHSGFLQRDEAIKMMIARDFSHPIVKMMYDKIGSWTLTNGKETEIQAKAKEYYQEAESEFCLFPEKAWAQLESFNAKPKELPPPDKIPTLQEMKSFKERLAEYQQKLEEAKLSCGGTPYKEFDENKIKLGGRDFDQVVYNEYRDYLMSIPEEKTMILPVKYLYERNRFLNMKNQKEILEKAGYVPESQRTPQEQMRTGNGKPTKIYKNWQGD